MESIAYIKCKLNNINITEIPEAVKEYKSDERKGVAAAVESALKRYNKYIAEQKRLDEMSVYENECYNNGCIYVAGIDEVGRGPLAGPVVTCAVILKKGARIEGVNDSKKLSKAKREELYEVIVKEALDYSIGVVSPAEIDEINILQATYKAMKISVDGLKIKPDFLLADAVTIPEISVKQKGIIKGDAKSISIAASSIVAKVTRDRMMEEYSVLYPEYDFENNVGYGSARHLEAIKKYGITPIHRRTFLKNFL
ncbi:ribonuclease HII [Anaerotignum faecicola]|nr:ribonuclease HII [Anaerotignum faecicola]